VPGLGFLAFGDVTDNFGCSDDRAGFIFRWRNDDGRVYRSAVLVIGDGFIVVAALGAPGAI